LTRGIFLKGFYLHRQVPEALPNNDAEGDRIFSLRPLASKRMRGGNDGGDMGCAKEKDRASHEETHKVEEDAVGLAYHRVAVEDAAADADVVAEAGSMRTEEAIVKEVTAAEVVAPRTATDETVAEEVVATKSSSGQAGQEEKRETVEEAMEEALAGVGTLEPQETAARASSDVAPTLGTETGTPVPEIEVDKFADPSHAGADAGPEKVSQEPPAARTKEGDRSEASVIAGAGPKSTSGGRASTAPTGSSVGSQSFAS
jgi:hypothetical protein